jgi:hypothetical protein
MIKIFDRKDIKSGIKGKISLTFMSNVFKIAAETVIPNGTITAACLNHQDYEWA